MDISWKQTLLGVVAIGMTAAVIRPSAFEDHPVPPPAPKVKEVATNPLKHPARPDGYMTEWQCERMQNGMPVADLVWKYGWPRGRYSFSDFDARFHYPIRHQMNQECVIKFENNEVIDIDFND